MRWHSAAAWGALSTHLDTLQQLSGLAELVLLRMLADILHHVPVDQHLEREREDHWLQH